jgi:hypothetical protein
VRWLCILGGIKKNEGEGFNESFINQGSNPGSSDSLTVVSDHWTIPSVPGVSGVISVYIVFKEMKHSS